MNSNNNLPASYPAPIITLACLTVIIAGMKAAAPLLNPLFLSIFLTAMCWPALTWLTKKGTPPFIAVTLIIVGLVILLTLMGAYVGSAINVFTKALPGYQANLMQKTSGLLDALHSYGFALPQDNELIKEINAGRAMHFAGAIISSLGDIFTNVFFILLTVIFLLFESFILPEKLEAAFDDSSANDRTETIINNLNQYLGLKLITSLVTGLLVTGSLALIGLDFPVLWGVIAFMLNFVPNIGSIIAAIPAVLLAMVQLDGNSVVLVIFCYFSINMLVGNFWEPKIMGQGLGLSTLVVFLSLTFWGWVFGSVGMLLSVPFTMIAKIVLENNPETRWIAILLGSGEGLTPKQMATEKADTPSSV